jgi:hypothetical protein
MTRIVRPQIGPTEDYRGHQIIVRYFGPDLICEVDGEDLAAFYIDADAARRGGQRYVDDIEKDKAKAGRAA